MNNYQKTERSVRYAILCSLLTFAAFFLVDTMYKKGVHPLQYGLIGLALVLFYVLLLSFSEYIGFNFAYVLASVATIGLIGWFCGACCCRGGCLCCFRWCCCWCTATSSLFCSCRTLPCCWAASASLPPWR